MLTNFPQVERFVTALLANICEFERIKWWEIASNLSPGTMFRSFLNPLVLVFKPLQQTRGHTCNTKLSFSVSLTLMQNIIIQGREDALIITCNKNKVWTFFVF